LTAQDVNTEIYFNAHKTSDMDIITELLCCMQFCTEM